MIKLFLDENITRLAENYFISLGYNVSSINIKNEKGLHDNEVFSLAQNEERVLITHNGRHFIILVPPKYSRKHYHGIIWLKPMMTRLNYESICSTIHSFFSNYETLENQTWVYNKNNELNLMYPKPTLLFH